MSFPAVNKTFAILQGLPLQDQLSTPRSATMESEQVSPFTNPDSAMSSSAFNEPFSPAIPQQQQLQNGVMPPPWFNGAEANVAGKTAMSDMVLDLDLDALDSFDIASW